MNILFATDGAEPSRYAEDFLARAADPARARVHTVGVSSFATAMAEATEAGGYSPEAAMTFTRGTVDEAVERLREAGLETDGEVREGDEATEILAEAVDSGAELIVTGTGKERWIDTVVLGSVSSSVLHAADRPVLVVHTAPEPDRPVRVLIGVDGSDGSSRAVGAFMALADPGRCEVTVLSVVKPMVLPPGAFVGAGGLETVAGEEQLAAARVASQETATVLREAGFAAAARTETGGPARVLLDEAERIGADLLVVGARGLGRFRSKVLGSVSDKVVRRAPATLVGR